MNGNGFPKFDQGEFSHYFSLAELIASQTAHANGIDNTPNSTQVAELSLLSQALHELRLLFAEPMLATNGYRSRRLNIAVGGALDSAHMYGMAVDFAEYTSNRRLARFFLSHQNLMEKHGLWMEDPQWTPSWVHIQTRPIVGLPAGIRYFRPNSSSPLATKLREQGGTA